jgi:hypothetical protein
VEESKVHITHKLVSVKLSDWACVQSLKKYLQCRLDCYFITDEPEKVGFFHTGYDSFGLSGSEWSRTVIWNRNDDKSLTIKRSGALERLGLNGIRKCGRKMETTGKYRCDGSRIFGRGVGKKAKLSDPRPRTPDLFKF